MAFQMQSWEDDHWEAMEDGAAGHVWRPRRFEVDAIAKCLAWTGFLMIPAMQVVDVATGRVVWRGSGRYPEAGPCVGHRHASVARRLAYDLINGDARAQRVPVAPVTPQTDTLF